MKNPLLSQSEPNIINFHAKINSSLSGIDKLLNIRDNHSIWDNPLLKACSQGEFDIEDYRFIFSQYYYYSKSFTKLLSACMVNCDNDYYRSMLSANLWEEGGGLEIDKRHSELYRRFLKNHLQININDINFEVYTEYYFNKYLDLCLNQGPIVSAAALSFGTEGIVSRLYTTFYQGLKNIGFNDEQLIFFSLHIECDDEHAETLEEMTLSYQSDKEWLGLCEKGITQALDLRNKFFTNIYESLQFRKLKHLIKRVNTSFEESVQNDQETLYSSINQNNKQLYSNTDLDNNISFSVQRVPFEADVLDPRVVVIPAGFRNELHNHAHETVFLIIEGTGEVIVDDKTIPVQGGDLIFIPRWRKHQAHNTGIHDFKYFAVTDYGFTKVFPQNSEKIYRLKKENVISK
jgi:pyrroloquinoline quinone (PQQ) biosynthesis protein C/mannose-6-phosphate isomerase-like protein (cupin superfamily)